MDVLPRLRKPTWFDFVQAIERAGRAAVVAFIGVYPAQSLYENLGGTAPVDVDLAKKAALAAGMAAIAFLWRWLLPDVGRSRTPADDGVSETASHLTDADATEA